MLVSGRRDARVGRDLLVVVRGLSSEAFDARYRTLLSPYLTRSVQVLLNLVISCLIAHLTRFLACS